MGGVGLAIEINDARVNATLLRLVAAERDTRPFMTAAGAYLLSSSQRRFETTSAPGGAAWARLAPRTARERIRLGYGTTNILRRTTLLYSSLTYVVGDREVEVGTNNPYARIHQFGGEITHYARSQRVYQRYDPKTDVYDQRFRKRSQSNFARWVTIPEHVVRIPARPYLGVDEADTAALLAIGEDFLRGIVGGLS